MKVIFLDVDGVLNNDATLTRTVYWTVFVDDYLIERLKRLVEKTNAKIVLSSSWRVYRENEKFNKDFCQLVEKLNEFGLHIDDYTPEFATDDRGEEIDAWLKANPNVKNFVILDDDKIKLHADHHVRTINRFGLTDKDVDKAIQMLNT